MRRSRISMQPISMMRSPSFALRPVVSVSSTTCLVIDPPVRELVRSFVFWMPGVTPNPMPLYLMSRRELVEAPPEILVFHRLLVSRFPSLAFPGVDPLGDALLNVLRIGMDVDPARALQRLEGADHRGELHPVVGGCGLAAEQFPFVILEKNPPAARPRVSPAGAVGVDLQ